MKRLILVFASAMVIVIALSWVRRTDAPVQAPADMQTRSQVEPPNAAWTAQLARLKEEQLQETRFLPDLLIEIVLSTFGVLFLILGYFLKTELARNAAKHAAHYRHEVDMSVHATERDRTAVERDRTELKDQLRLDADALIRTQAHAASELQRHQEQDDRRFDRIEVKLDILSADIKDILKVVSK